MIKLVTISRISKEKGFDRMLKLEQLLIDAGIAFTWDCYGDTTTPHARRIVPQFRYVKFKGVTKKPTEIVRNYDYLVHLSSTEGFCYSVYEALSQKVPVIATNYDSIVEMMQDGIHGYILDMDLSNFDPQRILTVPVITEFKEKSSEQDWINFINMATKKKGQKPQANRNTSQLKDDGKTVTVEVTRKYHDTVLDATLEKGETHEVTDRRAKTLVDARVAKIVVNEAEEVK